MPTSPLRPATIALVLVLVALCACSSRGGGGRRSAEDPIVQRYAKIQRDAQSLMDRRAILDRELERTSAELLAWAKRYKVRTPTPQLLLSLLSRDYSRYQSSSEPPSEGFETEYAAIEKAMARIALERMTLGRDVVELKRDLEQFDSDPEQYMVRAVLDYGDVLLPLAGIDSTDRATRCEELIWGEHRTTCALAEERGKAVDPRRVASGWRRACIYTCYAPSSMR